jgi:tetraacyldisaccharide 4'-kinase
VDHRQSQHFEQVFETARRWLGPACERVRLVHVPFGTVLGEDGRPFKTRAGDTVGLEPLLDKGIEGAAAILSDGSRAALGVADRDRVSGAATAARLGVHVVVLDDGFQHRRLHRDLDVVAVDASDPFGCGHLFPRGLLRERVCGLARADAIVLTRATGVDPDRRAAIRNEVTRARGGRPVVWLETEHRPTATRTATGGAAALDSLSNRRVAAFCGIGNPAAFRRTLVEAGADLAGFRSFADHHAYGPADLESLTTWAEALGATEVLTTLKDLVKLRTDRLGRLPLAAVEVSLEPLTSAADLRGLVLEAGRVGDPAA